MDRMYSNRHAMEPRAVNPEPDDAALMHRIAARDAAAFRMLVDRHLGLCLRVAERMLGNRQDAEDVAQEVCAKLWRNPGSWKGQSRFSTWLYRVVYNAVIDHQRRGKGRLHSDAGLELVVDDRPSAEHTLEAREQSAQMAALLQCLPERQRAALVLCYYEELDNQEAALALGIRVGALQQLLFRARQNVKIMLLNAQGGKP